MIEAASRFPPPVASDFRDATGFCPGLTLAVECVRPPGPVAAHSGRLMCRRSSPADALVEAGCFDCLRRAGAIRRSRLAGAPAAAVDHAVAGAVRTAGSGHPPAGAGDADDGYLRLAKGLVAQRSCGDDACRPWLRSSTSSTCRRRVLPGSSCACRSATRRSSGSSNTSGPSGVVSAGCATRRRRIR